MACSSLRLMRSAYLPPSFSGDHRLSHRLETREDPAMPDLRVLTSDQQPVDQDNNIVLTEVVRSEGATEYTVTVLIDGKPVSVGGPFLDLEDAVDQANEEARHYALDPIYLKREQV
jgi:hypothetical protein